MSLQSLTSWISKINNSRTVNVVVAILQDSHTTINAPVTSEPAASFSKSKSSSYTCRYLSVSRLGRLQQQFLPCITKKNFLHTSPEGMELKKVVNILNDFANTSLAESWDNVGLLTEPSAPHSVRTILLTNDLTPLVLDEAIEKNADMILSYHPPIFSPMKRLTQKSWKEKLIVKCIEKRIAIYSPHTCYDALSGGVNDWLISAFGENQETWSSLSPVTILLNYCGYLISFLERYWQTTDQYSSTIFRVLYLICIIINTLEPLISIALFKKWHHPLHCSLTSQESNLIGWLFFTVVHFKLDSIVTNGSRVFVIRDWR